MKSIKPNIKIILMAVLCVFSLSFWGCGQSHVEIISVITVSDITESEYSEIDESNRPEGAEIEDFKKLYVDVNVSGSKQATERTISIPDLFIIDGKDRLRAVGGGSGEKNNVGIEDTAESFSYVIFDSRGLSEEDLRSLYNESEIYVAYKFKNGNEVKEAISIGEDLRIN